MSRLFIRPAARSDVRSARTWYERERPGLGREFLDDLDALLRRIRSLPRQFPEVELNCRRALLHRFPYAVYFLMPSKDILSVVAVLHQHRNPRLWRQRIRTSHDR
jgi:plasmid stabilization system protein ParE